MTAVLVASTTGAAVVALLIIFPKARMIRHPWRRKRDDRHPAIKLLIAPTKPQRTRRRFRRNKAGKIKRLSGSTANRDPSKLVPVSEMCWTDFIPPLPGSRIRPPDDDEMHRGISGYSVSCTRCDGTYTTLRGLPDCPVGVLVAHQTEPEHTYLLSICPSCRHCTIVLGDIALGHALQLGYEIILNGKEPDRKTLKLIHGNNGHASCRATEITQAIWREAQRQASQTKIDGVKGNKPPSEGT